MNMKTTNPMKLAARLGIYCLGLLVLAIGGAVIGGPNFSVSGIGLGIIAGIILNLVLPEKKAENK